MPNADFNIKQNYNDKEIFLKKKTAWKLFENLLHIQMILALKSRVQLAKKLPRK